MTDEKIALAKTDESSESDPDWQPVVDAIGAIDGNADGVVDEPEAKHARWGLFLDAFLARGNPLTPEILNSCKDERTQQILILAFETGRWARKLVFWLSVSPVLATLVQRLFPFI